MSNNNRWPSRIELQQSAVGKLNPHLFDKPTKQMKAEAREKNLEKTLGRYKFHIHKICTAYSEKKKLTLYREFPFHPARMHRFDWAFLEIKVAIEYEGIHSAKSRHTTVSGYSADTEKYNLAIELGWEVIRYTAKTYENIEHDLENLKNRKIKGKR